MARNAAGARQESSPGTSAGRHRLEAVAGNQALQLDRVIHERTRLAIMSALAAGGEQTFNGLKSLLDVTDGNLSIHCRRLEEAGYILCEKTFERRMPKTSYRLSAEGRRALERYLQHMEALIQKAREGAR
jgi:DNA-binding transcriptional ArsR family regulator